MKNQKWTQEYYQSIVDWMNTNNRTLGQAKEHEKNIKKAERVNKLEERIYTLENKMAGAQHRIETLEKRRR